MGATKTPLPRLLKRHILDISFKQTDMVPEREAARSRERAPVRAEHIEMLAAIGSQGLGDCLNWIVSCSLMIANGRTTRPPKRRRGEAMPCDLQDYVDAGDDAEHLRLESLARDGYDRCHPDDSFDDMKRRASFSREDRGLYRDWLAAAAALAAGLSA